MSPRGIIALVFVLLIVVAAGLVTGILIQKISGDTATVPIEDDTSETALYAPPPNPNIFVASTPHRGYAHRTIDVEITSQENGKTSALLPLTEAVHVNEGQTVFLYNEKAELLALPARVSKKTSAEDSSSDIAAIEISFSSLPGLPPEKLVAAQIIIESFDMAERLPLAALQKDNKGKPFLWEAIRLEDGRYRAKRRPLEWATEMDWQTLVYKNRDHVSDIYIVNPDPSLAEGQIIAVTEHDFKAPDFLKPSRIESAYKAKLAQYEDIRFAKEHPVGVASTACGTSCGGAAASQDFIARVRALAAKIPPEEKQP